MRRSWYEMQGQRNTTDEPCPTEVGERGREMPRALAGWPDGCVYRPREPVLDFNAQFRLEALEVLRRPRRDVAAEDSLDSIDARDSLDILGSADRRRRLRARAASS